MIWESSDWKYELIKDADILQRWSKKRPSSKQAILFEKKIMISAYAIRKLIEAEKIGSDIKTEYWYIKNKKFSIKDNTKQPDLLNWHQIDRFYNIEESGKNNKIELPILCNLIIHSYVFCLSQEDKDYTDGFFVTSGWEKNNGLYWIDLDDFITVLIGIGQSNVYESHWQRNNKKTSGWTIKRKYSYKSTEDNLL